MKKFIKQLFCRHYYRGWDGERLISLRRESRKGSGRAFHCCKCLKMRYEVTISNSKTDPDRLQNRIAPKRGQFLFYVLQIVLCYNN